MSGRDSFGSMGLQKSPVPSAQSPVLQNVRIGFSPEGTALAVYKPMMGSPPSYPITGSDAAQPVQVPQHGFHMSEPMKRKRGRPRKYGPDGTMALALTPVSPPVQPLGGSLGGGFASPTSPLGTSVKKARGRPPGSGKKRQMAALGSAGTGFTPHVITVKAGEVYVTSKTVIDLALDDISNENLMNETTFYVAPYMMPSLDRSANHAVE
ncbi:hypothetical protein ACLOJK_021254 [Asimina triloba]